MKTSDRRPPAFAILTATKPGVRRAAPGHLILRATDDGWSLIGPEGEVVFRARGVGGRHQCLEFAHAHGSIAVFS
jgi:hypothetical protein